VNLDQALKLYRRLLYLQMTPSQAKSYVLGAMPQLSEKQKGLARGWLERNA
jgi:hypothetical protein